MNKQIRKIFLQDQKERNKIAKLNFEDQKNKWPELLKNDKERRKKIRIILNKANRESLTGYDYFMAGIIFQHGMKNDYLTAGKLAKKGMELKNKKSAWLYAASTDRWLMSQGKKQKFGTQFVKKTAKDKWRFYPINKKTTDEERKKYGIKSLKELRNQVEKLNKTS